MGNDRWELTQDQMTVLREAVKGTSAEEVLQQASAVPRDRRAVEAKALRDAARWMGIGRCGDLLYVRASQLDGR